MMGFVLKLAESEKVVLDTCACILETVKAYCSSVSIANVLDV